MPSLQPRPLAGTVGIVSLTVLALAALAGCAPPPETGPVTQFTAVVADDLQCRTSGDNTVAPMPSMVTTFTQAGPDTTSIIVSFQGNWSQTVGGDETVGAFIFLEVDGDRVDVTSTNGGVLATPGPSHPVGSGTHGFNFVTEPILPGPHTATILWADNVLNGTNTICVHERSMVVHHR